jgi:hypothetical protein
MMCPFSGKFCTDCAFYRGRHYFLCFCEDYRGHVDEPGQVTNVSGSLASGMRSSKKFEMPRIVLTKESFWVLPNGS